MESNNLLGTALELRDQMRITGSLVRKGKRRFEQMKKRWASNLEEYERFSEQLTALNGVLQSAFKEKLKSDPENAESITKLVRLSNLMGQFLVLAPLCHEAIVKFAKCLKPGGDFEVIDGLVKSVEFHNIVKNDCIEAIRKLRDLENIVVRTVGEAHFVKTYTQSRVVCAEGLTKEVMDEIQAMSDS